MLVLSRKRREVIYIGDKIKITVTEIDGGKVRVDSRPPRRSLGADQGSPQTGVIRDEQAHHRWREQSLWR